MKTPDPALEAYLDTLGYPDYKKLVLRIQGLSRRKRERFSTLVSAEHQRLEFDSERWIWSVWDHNTRPVRNALFVVIGILANHTIAQPQQLTPDVVRRVNLLIDRLEAAVSAFDVAEFPQ